MPKYFLKMIIALLILLPISSTIYAQLSTSINRTQFAPRDTIVLTIETSKPTQSLLDTSPLTANFLLLDQKEMTINSYAEGKRTSIVRWQLQLRARVSGHLDIPSLSYNDESSQSVSIFIKSNNQTRFLPVTDLPIILDAQIDKDDNYENALITYTLNLYSDHPLQQGYLISPPKLDKGEVTLLEESELTEVEIRGKQYQLLELRYAIFPQEMGRYIIEGPIFQGAQLQGTQLEVRANNLEINVRTRQDFENAKYWLPASQLTLTETWDTNGPFKVGDIIERTVTLTAKGLLAEQLPPLITENSEIVNILDSQVSLSQTLNKNGIEGTRIERQSMQLLERGELTSQNIDIYWWDTVNDNQQVSRIDKKIFNVQAGENGESSIEREQAQNQNNQVAPIITVIETENSWIIWLLVSLLVISGGAWLFHMRRARRLKETQQEAFDSDDSAIQSQDEDEDEYDDERDREQQDRASIEPSISTGEFNAKAELNSFQTLGRSCLQNDIISAHNHLIAWANCFWYEQHFTDIDDIAKAANSPAINLLLAEMKEQLDEFETDNWQGKELFNLLTQLRSH
ncbi:hypothetical protein WN093_02230 [Gammaproteobacteria bacterium AS21]|jgi:hypothetical protein